LKIAVTGAGGHVGASLVRELLSLQHEVSVLYYNDNRAFDGLAVRTVKGSLFDANSLTYLIKGHEI